MIVTLAFEPFECPTDIFGNSLLEFETIVTFGVVPEAVMVIVVFRPPFQRMPFESEELVVIVAKPLADEDDDDHDDDDE